MEFDPVAYINDPDWHTSVYGLDRIRELVEGLGNPQKQLKFVHVGGTNGKGSVCAYLDSVLRKAGYTCGLFTSPYIETFEERIRVNGQNISADDLRDVTLAVRDVAEAMEDHPTEFELMCAVAMLHFARSGCDIVVAEVGLGGRWDATNVIDAPECCIIVRIGLVHTELLGDTTGKIASEKAGIIKPGTHVVSWPQDDDALASIRTACKAAGVPLVVADLDQLEQDPVDLDGASAQGSLPARHFAYKGEEFDTQLLATYQPANATLAIEALGVLRDRGWKITDEALHAGIAEAVWPGRFEVMGRDPLVIVDGGHNPQGADVLAQTLRDVLPETKPVFIVGILGDKDYGAMLERVVDLGEAFVCVTPPNPRALSAEDLSHSLLALKPDANAIVAKDFDDAVSQAYQLAGQDGAICAFGSLYSIHDLKAALRAHE
ncbi:MAG: bifunctional folylpolyglutamate synthase/dihydrofolate synthase [Eggerthellaceae bacterium]|nr:bifunctional folylpolyglutamate synthase/dihydrofolate synthase [Eggerthellaceae bacterium]